MCTHLWASIPVTTYVATRLCFAILRASLLEKIEMEEGHSVEKPPVSTENNAFFASDLVFSCILVVLCKFMNV